MMRFTNIWDCVFSRKNMFELSESLQKANRDADPITNKYFNNPMALTDHWINLKFMQEEKQRIFKESRNKMNKPITADTRATFTPQFKKDDIVRLKFNHISYMYLRDIEYRVVKDSYLNDIGYELVELNGDLGVSVNDITKVVKINPLKQELHTLLDNIDELQLKTSSSIIPTMYDSIKYQLQIMQKPQFRPHWMIMDGDVPTVIWADDIDKNSYVIPHQYNLWNKLLKIYPQFSPEYRPAQTNGNECDFGILLNNGKTLKAVWHGKP